MLLTAADQLMVGDTAATRAYLGPTEVWSATPAALLASSFGAPSDPATDRTTIAALFDAAAAAEVPAIIDGNYTVEWGLTVPDAVPGVQVAADCTLALANARTSTLTANTTVGATEFAVTDGTKFRVGELVAITDSNRVIQGGSNQTRRNGFCARVTSIVGNTVTLADASLYAFTTAAGATMGSCTGLLYITATCEVSGPGTLDGNKAGSFDVHLIKADGVESRDGGSALYMYTGTGSTVSGGLTVKGGSLHGLMFHAVTDGSISGCTFQDAHDKNLALRGCVNVNVSDVTCTNSAHEDGIILYSGNSNVTVSNVTVSNCNRFGVSLGSGQTGLVVSNVVISDCGRGFQDVSTGATISDITLTDCGAGQFGLVGGFGFEFTGSGGSVDGLSLSGACTFTGAALGFNNASDYTVDDVILTKGTGSGATISGVRFYNAATAGIVITNLDQTDWRWGIRGEVTTGITSASVSGLDTGSVTDTLNVLGIDLTGMTFA
jgi:hypothetical protein